MSVYRTIGPLVSKFMNHNYLKSTRKWLVNMLLHEDWQNCMFGDKLNVMCCSYDLVRTASILDKITNLISFSYLEQVINHTCIRFEP